MYRHPYSVPRARRPQDCSMERRHMTNTTQRDAGGKGLLARHKKTLMAGVFGLGVLGLAAGDLVIQPTNPAWASSQTSMVAPTQALGFADVVEKVRPAVVSVKVKTV